MVKYMKFRLIILFIISNIFFVSVNAQQVLKYPKRILLIGNSYTLNNDMPKIFQELIDKTGDSALVQSTAVGGYYLKNHSIDEKTLNTIKQGNWDYVIIQEQSQLPALSDDIVKLESYPYISKLVDTIRQYNKCALIGFFITWGRKYGDTSNCRNYPELCTYEGMDNALRRRYLEYSEVFKGFVVPIGLVWYYIRNFYPTIELYHPDNSHPSLIGSIVVAYSMYSAIFRKSPFNLVNYSKINLELNTDIKSSVNQVIFDKIDWWYSNVDIAEADYLITINDSNSVTFKNSSKNSDFFMWNYNKIKLNRNNEYKVKISNNEKVKLTLIAKNCFSNDKKTIQLLYNEKGLIFSNNDLYIKLNKTRKNVNILINNFDIFKIYKAKIYKNINGKFFKVIDLNKQNNSIDLLLFPDLVYIEIYENTEIIFKGFLNLK